MDEKKPGKKKWIKAAIPKAHEGKFAEKAKQVGETTREFAEEKAGAPGRLGKEARLAETLEGLGKKSRRSVLYDKSKY
jgi:hypothetical protein